MKPKLRNSFSTAVILVLAMAVPSHGQIASADASQRIPSPDMGVCADIEFSALPASVKLKGGRLETGWFLIVTDTAQRVYRWRLQQGTSPAAQGPESAAFFRGCIISRGKGNLAVSCVTDRRLLMSVSRKQYAKTEEVLPLVQSEFNSRAAKLDSGFDYFDKVTNLWSILGAGFFSEPGHAEGIRGLDLRALAPSGDGWSVTVGGAGGKTAILTLSSVLEILNSSIDR